jgi:hypothetical protein
MNKVSGEVPHTTTYESGYRIRGDVARRKCLIWTLALKSSGDYPTDSGCTRSCDCITKQSTAKK